ncbi:energy-coupling factor transporter transmembrane component T family protein [Cellulomonas endophytica]|uniref:energy-coupling factor transporter transmembrane component T family protein n=1 Tax=Cellulomonas endophytica TaxID=2494735 RepID=UPI00101382A2|nr:energy-coupling factor transporter transmembrane component T [Cellulomonas endophytica]
MSASPLRQVVPSPLARRDPTVKLALLTLVSLVALLVLDPVTPAVLYGLALVGVAVATRAPARTLLLAHVPFVAFAAGVLVVNALSRSGTLLAAAGPLVVTREGLALGVALAARTLLVGVLALGFVLSTDGVALMTSLHQHARLGPRVTYAVLAGYRMLEEMPREWTLLQHAHAVRAPLRRDGRPALGPRHHLGVVFGLLVVSLRKGERMAQALESRGLGLAPRTTWRPVPLTRGDAVLVVAVLAPLAAVLATSAALGLLEGPGTLTR